MKKQINKIMVLSGKRGGFGAMKSLLRKINTSKKFKLILVLTDQHLDKKFGNTYKEVQKEFLVNNKFKLYQTFTDFFFINTTFYDFLLIS